MIEDIDIRVRFQDPVDEPGFGYEDGETGEKGEDQGSIEPLQFHSQSCKRKSHHPSRLGPRGKLIKDSCICWEGAVTL